MNINDFRRLTHVFRWGGTGTRPDGTIENDCTSFCGTWVQFMTGIDAAAKHRGQYDDAASAARIIKSYGGLVPLMSSGLEPLGFKRVQSPETGDIGVITALVGLGDEIKQIGAIRFGPLWLTLAPTGVAAKQAEHVAVWRMPNA